MEFSPATPASERYAWYMNPAPHEKVLRNVPGYQDQVSLTVLDYTATSRRRDELLANPDLVARTYDADHLRAVHKQLFQDVYEWAGEYRIVDMAKDPDTLRRFGCWHDGEIDRLLADAHDVIKATNWSGVDEESGSPVPGRQREDLEGVYGTRRRALTVRARLDQTGLRDVETRRAGKRTRPGRPRAQPGVVTGRFRGDHRAAAGGNGEGIAGPGGGELPGFGY